MKQKGITKKAILCAIALALLIPLTALVVKAIAASVATNLTVVKGADGSYLYEVETENGVVKIKAEYFHNSQATLSYDTKYLYFTKTSTGRNPTSKEYVPIDTSTINRYNYTDGSQTFEVFSIPVDRVYQVVTDLYGAEFVKEPENLDNLELYLSQGFVLKRRDTAQDEWNVDVGPVYNTPAGIQGAAGWSFETRSNFQYYFDCQLKLNIRQYNITVEAGEGGTVGQSQYTAYLDEQITIDAYPDDDHNFAGWEVIKGNLGNIDKSLESITFTMPASDVEVKAKFKAKSKPPATNTPVPTPNPALPSPTPEPTPKPEPTPRPTYVPTQSSRIDKSSVRYYTTDAGVTMNRLYVGDITPKDSSFGYLANIYSDTASRITNNPTTAKGDLSYAVGRDSSGNEWYFIPSGNNATYVHPKTYKGYVVDSADIRHITELTFPSAVTYDGSSYTVTSIGGGTDSYNEYSYNRDPDSYEIWTTGIIENNYSQNLSWNGGNFRESIVARIRNTFGVAGNGEITSYGLDGYYYDNGLSEVECYENSYYVYNTTLQFVTIPSTVTDIEANAFYNCQALKRIIGGDGVTTIGISAFSGATHLSPQVSTISNYPDGGGVHSYKYRYYNGAYAFGSPTSNMLAWKNSVQLSEYMQLPEFGALKYIWDLAFSERKNLFDVFLPKNLNSIGMDAFLNCCLDSITIPGKTTQIANSYDGYGTLGTKGRGVEPKTLIITTPSSIAMEYGLLYYDYYALRAGYTVTYHNNSTPADTYVSTAMMNVTAKKLKERIGVYVDNSEVYSDGSSSILTNNYEVFLDKDGGLWLKKEGIIPTPCMPELTFNNIVSFSVSSGSYYNGGGSGKYLSCCLAFADDGTVWGYQPETVTWVNVGIPAGSKNITTHIRNYEYSGQYGGESKEVFYLFYLNPNGALRRMRIYNDESSGSFSSSSSSFELYGFAEESVSQPPVSFVEFSVPGTSGMSGGTDVNALPEINAKDATGKCWKYSTDEEMWYNTLLYETFAPGPGYGEWYDESKLGPVPVDYNFSEVLYDLMFDTMGREFLGWTLRADGTGMLYQPGDELAITAPTTIYAKWDGAAKKKIVYIPNGGYGKMEDDVYPADTPNPVTLRKNNPPDDGYERKGYEFVGWSYKEEPGPSDTIYADGAQIVVAPGVTKLYAQWKPFTYTVKVGTEDVRVPDQTFTTHTMELDTELILGSMSDKTLTVSYNLNGKDEGQTSMRKQPEYVTELTDANTKASLAFYGWRLYEDTNEDGKITGEDMYIGYYSANITVKNLTSKKNATLFVFPYWGGSASYVKLPEITCAGYHLIGFTPGTAYAPDYFADADTLNYAVNNHILVMAPNGSGARYQPKKDGEVLYAYYETEYNKGGKVYGFEVYEVFGAIVWDEAEEEELSYTVGVRGDSGDIWDTLPLRTGVHPYYRNAGGLPLGAGISFRLRSTGIYAEEDVVLTIKPHLCQVVEDGYKEVDVYYEEETEGKKFLKCWEPDAQVMTLQAEESSIVDEEALERVWFGRFSLPTELWVTEPDTEVWEYQKRYGLDFSEVFWRKEERLMLRFEICLEKSQGEQICYGMVPEGDADNIWTEEAKASYREDTLGNKYRIQGGEIAVVYPRECGDEEYRIYGIY